MTEASASAARVAAGGEPPPAVPIPTMMGNSNKGPGTPDKASVTVSQPRGRPPKGKYWHAAKGEWLPGVGPKLVGRPRGRSPKGMTWNPISGTWVSDVDHVKDSLDKAYNLAAQAAAIEEQTKMSALDQVKEAVRRAAAGQDLDPAAQALLVDTVAAEAAAAAVRASSQLNLGILSAAGGDFTLAASQVALASVLGGQNGGGKKRGRDLGKEDDEPMSMSTKRRMRRGKAHGIDLKEAVDLLDRGLLTKSEFKEVKVKILKTDPNPPKNAKVVASLVNQVPRSRRLSPSLSPSPSRALTLR